MCSTSPVGGQDFVGHVGRGLHEIQIGFALEPLLDDFHVQQPQKSAAEAEAQRIARLGLELEAGVVDAQLVQLFAQLFEILAVRRIQPAVHHALRRPIAGQRLGRVVAGHAHRVAHVNLAQRLDIADQVAHLPGLQLVARAALRHELPQLEHVVGRGRLEKANLLSFAHGAVHDPHIGDRAAVLVVVAVEDHRLQRRFRVALRRRHAFDDRFQQFFDSLAAFAAGPQHFLRMNGQHRFHLGDHFVGRACLRSTLFSTGTIVRLFSMAE